MSGVVLTLGNRYLASRRANNGLIDRMRSLLFEQREARNDPAAAHLMRFPGWALAVTALIAAVGDGKAFRSGRELAAFLRLVPHQHSTGGEAGYMGANGFIPSLNERLPTTMRTIHFLGLIALGPETETADMAPFCHTLLVIHSAVGEPG